MAIVGNGRHTAPEVTIMAEKATKKEVKPAEKKVSDVLDMHPQVRNTARGLFRNENGTTIVQERVPRGDLPQDEVIMPRNEYDLTEDDLKGLAEHAKKIVDPILAKYDEDVANEDAVAKAVWSKDGGKYQSRLSAASQKLVLDLMKGKGASKKAAVDTKMDQRPKETSPDAKPPELPKDRPMWDWAGQTAKPGKKPKESADIDSLVNAIPTSAADIAKTTSPKSAKPPKEAGMDKEMLRKEADDLRKKLNALKVLLCEDGKEEEEVDIKDAAKAAPVAAQVAPAAKAPEAAAEQPREVADKTILASLDEIAEMVEKEARDKKDLDLFRIAYQIDRVSDYLGGAKEASTLQQDPDEDYMRKAFKSAVNEHDADEPYMKEFSNDNTKETTRVVGNVSVQHKQASELPYAVKKDS